MFRALSHTGARDERYLARAPACEKERKRKREGKAVRERERERWGREMPPRVHVSYRVPGKSVFIKRAVIERARVGELHAL